MVTAILLNLVQFMLAKVDDGTVIGYLNYEKTISNVYSFQWLKNKTYTVLDSMPFTWTVNYTLTYYCDVSSSYTVKFYFNETTIYQWYPNYNQNLSWTVPFIEWNELNLIGDLSALDNYTRNRAHDIKNIVFTYSWNFNISKWYNIVWKPRELKQITQKASTTMFGVHTDRTRITQDAE